MNFQFFLNMYLYTAHNNSRLLFGATTYFFHALMLMIKSFGLMQENYRGKLIFFPIMRTTNTKKENKFL